MNKRFFRAVVFAGLTSILFSISSVQAADYQYGWYTDGYLVQYVDKSYCENSVGFKYSWYTDGSLRNEFC